MVEERFSLAYEKGNWWAVRDGDITLWKEETIATLNELYNENEKLKRELNIAEWIIAKYDLTIHDIQCGDYTKYVNKIKRLTVENGILKHFQNKVFELINEKIKDYSFKQDVCNSKNDMYGENRNYISAMTLRLLREELNDECE